MVKSFLMQRRLGRATGPFLTGIAILFAFGLPVASASSGDAGAGIAGITVDAEEVRLQLRGEDQPVRLVEFAFTQPANDGDGGEVVWEGNLDDARVTLERMNGANDRAFRKWRLFGADDGRPLGPQHFAADLSGLPVQPHPFPWPESIKGVTCPIDVGDMRELGVRHIHTNVYPAAWITDDPDEQDKALSYVVDGERIYFKPASVAGFDREVKSLTDAGINVAVVVINEIHQEGPGKAMVHPDVAAGEPGVNLSAFHVEDPTAAQQLRAWFSFVAERYSRPDMAHGAVGAWVVSNEVNSHWAWHNMGEVEPEAVIRNYLDTTRLAWNAVRSVGSEVPVFISLEHHWTSAHTINRKRGMPGKLLLARFAELARQEGDFPWHLAYHPYPENLFKPDFWNDTSAVFSYDTPKITFKNLEVLAEYFRKPELAYEGEPRRLILSEQGFNRPDTEDGPLLQAAAYALAYYKVERIPEIDSFILHRHVDHPQEGGLKLGLWTYGTNANGEPDAHVMEEKMPIWHVFRAADTPREEEAFAFALDVARYESWDQVAPRPGPFPEEGAGRGRLADNAVDLSSKLMEADIQNALAVQEKFIPDGTGAALPGWLQHPPVDGSGAATATMEVSVPEGEINLHFGTLLDAPSRDGVEYAVLVGDEVVFSQRTASRTLEWHDVDLSKWAGRDVNLVFRVDPLENSDHDAALWVQPALMVGARRGGSD